MPKARIITGQYVALEQNVASVGDRLAAALIDYVFLSVLTGIMLIPLSRVESTRMSQIYLFVLVCLVLLYPLLLETFNNGRTIGKMCMKTRVVAADGSQPTFGQMAIRWLICPIEYFLVVGISFLCMLLSKKGQRIGDMAAGTIVIKEKNSWVGQVSINDYEFEPDYRPTYNEAAKLSVKQTHVIYDTLTLNNSNRPYYIAALAKKVRDTFGTPPPIDNNDEEFLRVLLNDYFYYNSTIQV